MRARPNQQIGWPFQNLKGVGPVGKQGSGAAAARMAFTQTDAS
jgi:hypothetical protein